MTTPSAGARASRRSASAAARAAAAASPPPADIQAAAEAAMPPETLSAPTDASQDDAVSQAEIDAAFGPSDIGPQSAVQTPPRPTTLGGTPHVAVEPVSARGGAIALPQVDLSRQLDASDFILPKLQLVQAMSKTNTLAAATRGTQGVPMGNWYHSSSNRNLGDVVYFVPVDMRKARSYFKTGEGLLCRSFDMLHGEGDPGIECEGTFEERHTLPEAQRGCPLRLFPPKGTPGGPPCGESYNYMGLILTDPEDPKAEVLQAQLTMRSTHIKPGKSINMMMVNEGEGVWHNCIIELGIESITNTRGAFFVPVPKFYDRLDELEDFDRIYRRAARLGRQMGAVSTRSVVETNDFD